MTIDEFLEARLAEDEHDAKNASGTATEREWVYGLGRVSDTGEYEGLHAETHDPRDGVHIARHDPARVLRQCAALQHAVELIRAANIMPNGYSLDTVNYEIDLRPIATIWSDHPEFQESWGVND